MAELGSKLLESVSRAEKLCKIVSDFIGGVSYDVGEVKSSIFELNRVFYEISLYASVFLRNYPEDLREHFISFFSKKARDLNTVYTFILDTRDADRLRKQLQLWFLISGVDINGLCVLIRALKEVLTSQ